MLLTILNLSSCPIGIQIFSADNLRREMDASGRHSSTGHSELTEPCTSRITSCSRDGIEVETYMAVRGQPTASRSDSLARPAFYRGALDICIE